MAEEKQVTGPLRLEREEFDAWHTSPTTMKVRRYLADLADNIREQWRNGEGWTEENRRYVIDLDDLRNLEFNDVDQFYGESDTSR